MHQTPPREILSYTPGAQVTLRYTVNSAYAHDPNGADENPYDGAILRPSWFATLGDFIFVVPHGGDAWPVTFRWGVVPKGWTVASDLEHDTMGRLLTVADVIDSTILGGTDVSVFNRTIPDGTLRLAIRGKWTFSGNHLADLLGRILTAQRNFWGRDIKGPFLVTLFPLAGTGSSGGTGRANAFALYGTPDTSEASFQRTIAHEHLHSWIPQRIGTMPDGPSEASDYWFSEGFTEFYTERSLLKAGIWSLENFVADLNDKLLDYDGSPVRNASNARITKQFWSDPNIEMLPYRRGMLLAMLWDFRLREKSAGKLNLDTVMFAARDRFVAVPKAKKPDAVKNFTDTLVRFSGIDAAPDIARYIASGATVMLPADLFGNCATVRKLQIPVFDIGFDVEKSAVTGKITGVEPRGPAYAAGLRDGMRRIARVGGKQGDSRVDISYRIVDFHGKERTIRYKPAGGTHETLQEISLTSGMTREKRAQCARLMSGG